MAGRELSADEIFGEVLELDPAERAGYLEDACRYAPALRTQVEALLRDYEKMGGFLDEPVVAPPLAGMQVAAGSRIGRYAVEGAIGAGGMGEVYRAHDTKLNRTVALKLLPFGRTGDGPLALRFLQEARLASALNHPNIVALYDIGRHEEVDFLVMEYVEGETLREMIGEGGMAVDELAAVGSQIALALGAAHAAGIVHRDIKPANIMVTTGRQVKVLDFGIAKRTLEGVDTQLTGEGQIVGTVAYMSPEQTRGEGLDFRSDLFSLGCVLYEAATGNAPFAGGSMFAVMHEINHGEPEPMQERRPELQPAFVRLVMRCLAKDKMQRPESAMELATELKSLNFATVQVARARVRSDAVAVLPLKIRGAASDQFLSISLAEALLHRLSGTGKLVVRPIASVLKFAGEEVDWAKAARELNVDFLVEGTIQVAGGRIRVLVQTHRVSDGATLASIKQDGDANDLFALQDRLTDAVSDVFVPQSGRVETGVPPTRNGAAFELYLRAVDRQVHVEKFEMASAIEMLTRATELDPGFADAWGLLAQACAQMGSHLDTDPKWFALGERAIARTLELDPVQCTALCARSMILWSPSRSFQNRAALRALNAAIRIDPGRPTARHQRSAILWHLGFGDAAEEDARVLKATSPALGTMHQAAVALQAGEFDRSADLYRRALEIEPNGVLIHLMAPVAILYAQRMDEARKSIRNAREMFPKESFGLGMEAILAGIEGDTKRAELLADKAGRSTHSMTHTHHTWHSCAAAYALAGKPLKAVIELERCASMGLLNPRLFMVDPYLKSLRDYPRFKTLVSGMRREQDAIRAEFGLRGD